MALVNNKEALMMLDFLGKLGSGIDYCDIYCTKAKSKASRHNVYFVKLKVKVTCGLFPPLLQ